MVSIAELARYDSRIMRIVGFVALVYLPVSLVSVGLAHFALIFLLSGETGCDDEDDDDDDDHHTEGYM